VEKLDIDEYFSTAEGLAKCRLPFVVVLKTHH